MSTDEDIDLPECAYASGSNEEIEWTDSEIPESTHNFALTHSIDENEEISPNPLSPSSPIKDSEVSEYFIGGNDEEI